MYQNPFAPSAALPPPIKMPLAPGPISRWRRSLPVPPGESPIKNAILAADAGPSGEMLVPPADPIQQASVPWDRLPPAEQLRLLKTESAKANRSRRGRPNEHAESIRFAATPLAQPAWMVPDDSAEPAPLATPAAADAAFDPFEHASVTAIEGVKRPAGGGVSHGLGDVPPMPSEPAMAAIVVADYVDSPEGWHARAVAAAHTAETSDELTAVVDDCRRGMEIAPPELQASLRRLAAWACNRRGELAIDAGHEEEALRDFQAAIEYDPDCWLALHNRGVTLAQRHELEAALADFNRVIELNPGLAIAYRNRGEVFASLDRMELAVRDYDRALEQMADDAMLYLARGYAYHRLGDYDAALEDLNESIRLDAASSAALTQRGNLYAERGAFERALADLRGALELDPDWVEGYRSLAWLLATCPDSRYRDAAQALAAAREAVARWPHDDPFMLDVLAAAHANAGHFAEACRVQQQAIEAAPAELIASMERRLALYRQRQAFRSGPSAQVRTAAHEETPPRASPTARPPR